MSNLGLTGKMPYRGLSRFCFCYGRSADRERRESATPIFNLFGVFSPECPRAPPFGVGDTRACFSHRIAKDSSHDRDIHSLRHCHAMLRPRTFVRGDEIIARTEQLAPLVTLPPVPWFRGRRQSPGTSRLQHNRRLRATAARTGASAATWQAL